MTAEEMANRPRLKLAPRTKPKDAVVEVTEGLRNTSIFGCGRARTEKKDAERAEHLSSTSDCKDEETS